MVVVTTVDEVDHDVIDAISVLAKSSQAMVLACGGSVPEGDETDTFEEEIQDVNVLYIGGMVCQLVTFCVLNAWSQSSHKL